MQDGNLLHIFCPLSLSWEVHIGGYEFVLHLSVDFLHVMLVLLPFDERYYLVGKDCRDANSMETLQTQADILCVTGWRNH